MFKHNSYGQELIDAGADAAEALEEVAAAHYDRLADSTRKEFQKRKKTLPFIISWTRGTNNDEYKVLQLICVGLSFLKTSIFTQNITS